MLRTGAYIYLLWCITGRMAILVDFEALVI